MQIVNGLVPASLSKFVFINDPVSTLRNLLQKIQNKDQKPLVLMHLVFDEIAKINTQLNVTAHLRNIAQELIHQISQLDLTAIHEAICKIAFKNSPLLLEFERVCHQIAFISPDAKAKLISGLLLTRLKKEDIEDDAAFLTARDALFEYMNELTSQIQFDHKEFSLALSITMVLQSHFEGSRLFNFLLPGIFSKECAQVLVQTLEELRKSLFIPKATQDEISHTLTYFRCLPLADAALHDPALVIDRLRLSSFWHHRKEKFSLALMLNVTGVFTKLKTSFKKGQSEPYDHALLECIHWHVNGAAASSPIQPLEIFVKAFQNLPHLYSHKFLEACFPESFFHNLDNFLQKDAIKERDVYEAFRRLEEVTEKGFKLFQGLLLLFSHRLKGLKFLQAICSRFHQAKLTDLSDFEDRPLRDFELFKMCYAIELVLPHKELFKKGLLVVESYLTPFSRQLVFNLLEETIGIVAKKVLGAPGSSKRTTPILKLPIDCTFLPEIRARGVSRVRASSVKTIGDMREEFLTMAAFSGASHIVQGLATYEYRAHFKTQSGQTELLRGAIESDKYKYCGRDLCSGKVNLPFIRFLQLVKDFIEGIDPIHKRGCIHGDIKPDNFVFNVYDKPLLYRKVTVALEGAVCDLGFLSSAFVGQPLPKVKSEFAPFVQPDQFGYSLGFTGTPDFTSPEQFANPYFAGDHFQAEVFSLGVAILIMYTRVLPEWVDIIRELEDDFDKTALKYKTKTEADILRAQEAMKLCVRQNINNNPQFHNLRTRKRLKEKLTQEEEFIFLLFSMLLVDPGERITLNKLRIEFRKLLISHPPRRKVVRKLTPHIKLLPSRFRNLKSFGTSGARTLKRMQDLLNRVPFRTEGDEKKDKSQGDADGVSQGDRDLSKKFDQLDI
jgi:serine/threonine protein kinase